MSYELGSALGTLRPETAEKPREVSCWQIAMRSFPPKLRAPGNPGGIQLTGSKSKDDERAWRSVPDLPTRGMTTLWPVGRKSVIQGYIDKLLQTANSTLHGGRGLPPVFSSEVPYGQGRTLTVDIPVEGLTPQDIQTLQTAAATGIVSMGDAANALIETSSGASGARLRALQFVMESFGLSLAAIAVGQYGDAELARDILQGLTTLACSIQLPFGINYIIAGVLQIAAWAAGAWDKGIEPAEMVGYSYHWSESQQRQVLRYRLMVQTCADRENIARGVKSMSIGQVRTWLQKTAYGLDKVGGGTNTRPSNVQIKRAFQNAMTCASDICGDPLDDARLIRQIVAFLKYAGATDANVARVEGWLWDARRIERVNQARNSGEVNYASGVSYDSIKNIGKFPSYWRDWAYDGKMTPELFTRGDLEALARHVRAQFLVRKPGQRPDVISRTLNSLTTWHWVVIGLATVTATGIATWVLTED